MATASLFRTHFGTVSPTEAAKFYCPLFGWTFRVDERDPRTVSFFSGSREVAASVPPVEGFSSTGGGWYPAFWVESVATSAERAVALGARVLRRSDSRRTRSAVVAGPTDEVFAFIDGPAECERPPVEAMLEIVTRDPRRARKFYEDLFGFTARGRGHGVTLHARDGSPVAGVSELHEGWEDHAFLRATGRTGTEYGTIPPHWMVYFCVKSLEETLARATFLGASVVVRHELDPLLPAALLKDPAGHYWSLIARH